MNTLVSLLWADHLPEQETTEYGLEIHRKRTWIRRYRDSALLQRVSLLRKLIAVLSLLQYAVSSIRTARRHRPTHVCCHNALMLPVAWAMARLSGATLEYLPHELETQRSGLSGLKKKIETWVERRFIHSARNVVVVCDPIKDWYYNAYGLKNLHVVRNVPEREAVTVHPVPEGDFRARFAIPSKATLFIYQGLFGPGRGTDMLLDVFSRLDPAKSHLVLMGYGDPHSQVIIDKAVQDHENIHYQPAVDREWIVSYSAGADIGVSINNGNSLSYRYSLPNKFFEYSHAGLALVVSDNMTFQADLITDKNLGRVTAFEKSYECFKALSEMDLSPFRRQTLDYAKEAVWEHDAQAFAEVYRATERN